MLPSGVVEAWNLWLRWRTFPLTVKAIVRSLSHWKIILFNSSCMNEWLLIDWVIWLIELYKVSRICLILLCIPLKPAPTIMTSVLTAIFCRICETLFSFLSSAGGDDLTLTFVMSYEIRNSSSSSRNRQTSTAAAARCTSNGLPDSFQHELEASLATSLYIRLSWVQCDGLDTRLCLFLVYFVCCSKVETKR